MGHINKMSDEEFHSYCAEQKYDVFFLNVYYLEADSIEEFSFSKHRIHLNISVGNKI